MNSDPTILIIEDSDAKLASIVAALHSCSITNIASAKSVKSALTKLRDSRFDLIIADMSLPTYDVRSRERGGTARPFGGIEVFDFLQNRGQSTPVVVVSSYPAIVDGNTSVTLPALAEKLKADYPEIFAGYVFFDSAYLTWELEMQNLIKEVLNGNPID